jgi:hypothetical protein
VSEGGIEPPFSGFRPVPIRWPLTRPDGSLGARSNPSVIRPIPPSQVARWVARADRIEDPLWGAFLAKARIERLSNTDGMRRMIRTWVGMPEPVPLRDTGSAADQISR